MNFMPDPVSRDPSVAVSDADNARGVYGRSGRHKGIRDAAPAPLTPDELAAFLAQDGCTCPECGYSLAGLQVERCPECGCNLASAVSKKRAHCRSWAVTVAGLVLLGLFFAMFAGMIAILYPRDLAVLVTSGMSLGLFALVAAMVMWKRAFLRAPKALRYTAATITMVPGGLVVAWLTLVIVRGLLFFAF